MFTSDFTDKDDASIWEEFKAGSRPALAYIYFRYAKLLMLYGSKISREGPLVEDCIHDLFYDLWNTRERLGATDSIKFYLFKILKRKLSEALGRQNRMAIDRDAEPIAFDQPVEHKIIEEQVDKDRNSLVENLLKQLNDNQREIIHLKFYAGLKNSEIAELLEMEHQSVKNILFRTITKIRKYLSAHNIGMPW